MQISEILSIAAAIITSVGTTGVIIFGLSNWLGRIWSNRIMEKDRAHHSHELEKLRVSLQLEQDKSIKQIQHELDIFREKHLKAHNDKIAIYRMAADIVASILADIEQFVEGHLNPNERPAVKQRFTKDRIRLYGYLGMFASQSVMDAQDELIDHLILIINGQEKYQWEKVREFGISFINEVRKDIDFNLNSIEYNGKL